MTKKCCKCNFRCSEDILKEPTFMHIWIKQAKKKWASNDILWL